MKIYSIEETVIGRFGLDLKKIMIKHGITSITPMFSDMKICFGEDGNFIVTGCNFKTENGEFEPSKLTLDECLDKYNELIAVNEITGDDEFLKRSEELMKFIENKFGEV